MLKFALDTSSLSWVMGVALLLGFRADPKSYVAC